MRRGFAVGPNTGNEPRYVALIVAMVVVAFGVFYVVAIRPNLVPKRFASVVEGKLYRSGALTPAAMEKVVKERGIRTVVDLGSFERDSVADTRQQRTADALGVKRFRFDLASGNAVDPNEYVRALEIMTSREHQPVLVYCNDGTGRTGCAVMLYRHIHEGKPMSEALDEAISHGYSLSGNADLVRTLLDWAPEIERAVRDGSVIDVNAHGERH